MHMNIVCKGSGVGILSQQVNEQTLSIEFSYVTIIIFPIKPTQLKLDA